VHEKWKHSLSLSYLIENIAKSSCLNDKYLSSDEIYNKCYCFRVCQTDFNNIISAVVEDLQKMWKQGNMKIADCYLNLQIKKVEKN